MNLLPLGALQHTQRRHLGSDAVHRDASVCPEHMVGLALLPCI